jgi:hypothetical protein
MTAVLFFVLSGPGAATVEVDLASSSFAESVHDFDR